MRWATLILGTCGGLTCGHLGALWLRESWRLRADPELAAAMGRDPAIAIASALALLLAMIAALAGGVLAHNCRARTSGALLIVAGLAPGMFDPRAFVVGSVLCLAGILALGLRHGGAADVAPPSADAAGDRMLSGIHHASVG